MDMNALNAAIRMSRAQSQTSDLPPLPFPAAVAPPALPGFFPSPSFFKPGVTPPLDWSLYGGVVRGGSATSVAAAAATSSQKPTTKRHGSVPSTSSTADQPLDLSVGSDKHSKPSSGDIGGLPLAGPSLSSPRLSGMSSPGDSTGGFAPLDLTKSRTDKHSTVVSPRSPIIPISSSKGSAAISSIYESRRLPDASSYAGSGLESGQSSSSMMGLAAPTKISLNCRRCSFTCSDTSDFQKHFTLVHNSVPSMDDIIVTSGTTRPSYTITHSSANPVWPPKIPTPKEPVRFHCSHCGWQCDISNAEMFTNHVTEHVSDSGNSYKCYYCKTDYHDPNHLREHIAAHAGINHYICSFCCIAFSSETMATAHMEQKHGLSLSHTDAGKWPASNMKMPSHSAFNIGGHSSGLLNIKKEVPEIITARVPPSYRSDVPMPTKMAAVSPISRPISNPSPESSKSNDSNSAPSSAGSSKPLVMKRTGFGQSLAKHIEAAISRELMGNKSPTMSDLMFMKSTSSGEEMETVGHKSSSASTSADCNNPLNLMSLLDKVVEESLRNVPIGAKPQKPDLKFMVTFSDDEDDAAAVSREKGSSSSLGKTTLCEGKAGKLSPNSMAKDEAVVSSSETPLSRRSSRDEQEKMEVIKPSKSTYSPQPSHVSHSVPASACVAGSDRESTTMEGNKVRDLRHDSSVSKRALKDSQQDTSNQQQYPECKRERRDSN